MKRFFLILAIQLISASVFAQGVEFQDLTLDQAVGKAKNEGKYVFIDVYTDWCGPCKMMDKEVYTMEEIGTYFNQKYINVKYNAEKGDFGPGVAKKFGVKAYPTFIVLDGDGTLIHMFAGGTIGVEFIDKVEESFNPAIAFGELERRYKGGDRSKKLVANYIKSLQRTFTKDVTSMIDQFVDSLSEEEIICEECLFLFDDYALLGSPRGKFLIDNVEKFRSTIGKDKIDAVLLKKYEAYYAGILSRQHNADSTEIAAVNNKLLSLNVGNTKIVDLYQEIIAVYISKIGANELFQTIVEQTESIENNQLDRILYFAVPSLYDLWSSEQANELVSLMHNDYTKNMVIKSLERLKK